jgi:prepilin-type N-terminal cleavage/methylation domain-containing protein
VTERGAAPAATPRAGFTLIEMMAVVLLTAIVLGAAVEFYLDLATASRAATLRVRTDRRAVALLDRIARDLQSAVLVKKPAETDPLAWPWLFLAEAPDGELGAQRLKFVSRGRLPRASALAESDLELVTYALRERPDAGFDLVRWTSPRLPEGLDRTFPGADDPGALVLAEGVAAFGVRLLGDQGEWVEAWDSSTLVDSAELPLAAEVSLALLADDGAGSFAVDETGEAPLPEVIARQVLLPVRPLDADVVFATATGEDDEEDADEEDDEETAGECITVAQCRAQFADAFAQVLADDPALEAVLVSIAGQCYADTGLSIPGVACE